MQIPCESLILDEDDPAENMGVVMYEFQKNFFTVNDVASCEV